MKIAHQVSELIGHTPLLALEPGDQGAVVQAHEMIQAAIKQYC